MTLRILDRSLLEDNIARVRERIANAARRAGRDPGDVTLVAVSKTQPPEVVAEACAVGLDIFGENRVEEAGPKAAAVARLVAPAPPPVWHMIGHLQSRKAEEALPWAAMVHSVDTVKLATRLNRAASARGTTATLPVLLEVNVSGETSKYGFLPAELPAAVEAIAALPALRIAGLMTMAPVVTDAEDARPVFAGLRSLRDDLVQRFPALSFCHLSMGMTDDFEIAIEEGATLVRIGRAIFGERT
jgi:pyridoxal phosphate enzyme (YggS family)